jgi:hypothetical protein
MGRSVGEVRGTKAKVAVVRVESGRRLHEGGVLPY